MSNKNVNKVVELLRNHWIILGIMTCIVHAGIKTNKPLAFHHECIIEHRVPRAIDQDSSIRIDELFVVEYGILFHYIFIYM